jgi:transcriptional regulator
VPPSDSVELPQGTLDLLILQIITLEPMHGWAISQRIQQVTRDVVQVPQGSLYPALHRLERRGWIAASWDVSTKNRRAKYYRLTPTGKKQLDRETVDWQRLVVAVDRVLKTC